MPYCPNCGNDYSRWDEERPTCQMSSTVTLENGSIVRFSKGRTSPLFRRTLLPTIREMRRKKNVAGPKEKLPKKIKKPSSLANTSPTFTTIPSPACSGLGSGLLAAGSRTWTCVSTTTRFADGNRATRRVLSRCLRRRSGATRQAAGPSLISRRGTIESIEAHYRLGIGEELEVAWSCKQENP